jgi:mannosyltransferase OCH1-like enzyme
MIPRVLHIIWVGDETRRPSACIQSWIERHPDWTVKLWGNQELANRNWINRKHMEAMALQEWNGVADMMRWEILFDEGGVLVDADSFCIQPLPDWLLSCEAFACWENELIRPGLVAAGYFGTIPRNPFLAYLIDGILQKETVTDRMAWASVGPLHLTETWKHVGYGNLTILPSHFFIPRHFTGVEYTGAGPVFARQEWGSTLHSYAKLANNESTPSEVLSRGQAFLFEPEWKGAGWVEVLLSYLQAFAPEDPVALAFVMDPAAPGQISVQDAESAVGDLIARMGRARFPTVILVDRMEELPSLLQPYPHLSWVPRDRSHASGFRGHWGARFAEARALMSQV